MKKYVKYILIIGLPFLFTACDSAEGSGNIVSQTRSTGDFEGVNVAGGFDVEIRKGDVHSVVIDADDNLIDNIESEVKNGVLHIRSKDHNLRNAHLKAIITAPDIQLIKSSAGADIKVNDVLTTKKMEFDASSGSKISAKVDAPEIEVESSSAADITLKGRTKNLKAGSSSGASINAYDLLSESSTVNSSSGADARVHASVNLDASASSGASVNYRGGANVKKSVSSGGEVEKND